MIGQENWNYPGTILKDASENTAGHAKYTGHENRIHDKAIAEMSQKHKQFRIDIHNYTHEEKNK